MEDLRMNILEKFVMVTTVTKAFAELKSEAENNAKLAEEIKDIIHDTIELLQRIKKVIPQVGKAIEKLINIISKRFK